MSTYLLEIVTPERLVYTEQVNSISVRGSEGDLGILPGHLPLVTPLKIAPIRIKIGGQTEVIAVNGGFVEVRKDKVVILAESANVPKILMWSVPVRQGSGQNCGSRASRNR